MDNERKRNERNTKKGNKKGTRGELEIAYDSADSRKRNPSDGGNGLEMPHEHPMGRTKRENENANGIKRGRSLNSKRG